MMESTRLQRPASRLLLRTLIKIVVLTVVCLQPFGGTPLGFEGAAEGSERKILAPFADDLPEGALGSDFAWPETDGEGRSRRNLRGR